jgi:hypothetical protein
VRDTGLPPGSALLVTTVPGRPRHHWPLPSITLGSKLVVVTKAGPVVALSARTLRVVLVT